MKAKPQQPVVCQPKERNKVLVILGTNASGKSSAAIALAKKFNGEVISADSRQVYRGMDIGTGKVEGRMGQVDEKPVFISEKVPHYMIDIVSPKTDYNVAKFKREVYRLMPWIINRGKLPIICGGTMFWISAVVNNLEFPKAIPDSALRAELFELSEEALYKKLKKLDPERADKIDPFNKVRLVRALEICSNQTKVGSLKRGPKIYDFLQIGMTWPRELLGERIKSRMEDWFKQGMIEEVKRLHSEGVSWKRLEMFGLEYRYVALYLQGKIEFEQMKEKLFIAIRQYAKRQMTWFNRPAERGRIVWENNLRNMVKLVSKFIN